MKKIISFGLFLTILYTFLLTSCAYGGEPLFDFQENQLKVGYGKACISPIDEKGEIIAVPLGGYAGLRVCKEIASDIFAICIAFEDSDGNIFLLFSIDIVGLYEDDALEIKNAITAKTGVKEENIFLCATHNHSAPEIGSEMESVKEYKPIFIQRVVASAENAIMDLTVCKKILVGNPSIEEYSYNRCPVVGETGEGVTEKDIDPFVPVFQIKRRKKNDIFDNL